MVIITRRQGSVSSVRNPELKVVNEIKTLHKVFTAYSQLCNATKNSILTQRRVSDLINELDMLGFITAEVISKGRYGRSKKISMSIPKTIINSVLEPDYNIEKVKHFTITDLLPKGIGGEEEEENHN